MEASNVNNPADGKEIPSLTLLSARRIASNPQLTIQNHADGFLILPLELRELIWCELRKTGNLLENIELFNLSKIDLSDISQEQNNAAYTLTYHTIKRIAEKCPELEELNIEGCHLASPEESLEIEQTKRIEALEQLKKNYPLHYATVMADEQKKNKQQNVKPDPSSNWWNDLWLFFKRLVITETPPPPQSLIIPSNPEMITSLSQFPKLRVLNIASCQGSINDMTVQEFIECCPKLQSFAISYCTHITDHALQALKKRKSIVSLSVAYCWRISDGMLLEILKKNPIAHLDVSGMIMLQPETISRIAAHNLVSLNLSGVACLGNAEIEVLATKATHIRSLNLSGCNHLVPASIVKLISSCKEIEELDLSNIRSLGNLVLLAISDNLPGLQILRITQTQMKIESSASDGFQRLIQECPQLTQLAVSISSLSSPITESLAGNRLANVTLEDHSNSNYTSWVTSLVGVIDAFPYMDTLSLRNQIWVQKEELAKLQTILESTYPDLTVRIKGHKLGKKWKHRKTW